MKRDLEKPRRRAEENLGDEPCISASTTNSIVVHIVVRTLAGQPCQTLGGKISFKDVFQQRYVSLPESTTGFFPFVSGFYWTKKNTFLDNDGLRLKPLCLPA